MGPIFILASCAISSKADNVLQADEQLATDEHQKHKGHWGYGGGRGVVLEDVRSGRKYVYLSLSYFLISSLKYTRLYDGC